MLGKRDITSLLIIFISSLCFGINTVYGASVTTSIKNIYPNLAKYEKEWSWFNNGARLSAGLGSFCFTPIIKWFGRRLSISIFGFINGIFFLLILAAGDEMMIYLLIVRIFHGLIWGVMSVLSLVYLFEMAPSNSYGFVGCMHQFFNVCGIVLVYLLSAFVDFQILSIINAVISFIFSGLIWITRDSPVSIRDKKIEKQKSLNTKSKSDNANKISKAKKFISKKNYLDFYKTVLYAIILFIFQQLSGSTSVFGNLSQIMANSGLSMNPNLQSALANCAQLVGVCISALLVDSIGQRILWCLSAFSCFIFLILYALTLKISMPNYTPPLFIFYFRLGYGFGVGPITFAVWVQLFSDKLRLVGTSLMMTGYYIVIWALVYGHPYALEACGDFYTTLIYAICTFFSIFFGAFCIPDHRNKDNEDMALI